MWCGVCVCCVVCCVVLCCDVLLCESATLPIREVASRSKCSVCAKASSGERPMARRSLPTPEPVNIKFCWQQKASDTIDGTRETTKSMHTLCHSSRGFSLQELIFAHCPHQPRSLIRGNVPHKSDWALSQRNRRPRTRHLADPGDSQLLITLIHLSQHCTRAIFARSVLAQESAATALSCRDHQNREKWTLTSVVDERDHCLSRLPCGHQA